MTSLRTHLVLWTIIIEALLLTAFAGTLLFYIYNSQTKQIQEILSLSGTELNAIVDTNGNGFYASDLESSTLSSRGVLAWIINPKGEVGLTIGVSENQTLPPTLPPLNQSRDYTLSDGLKVRILTTPLQEADSVKGTIIIAYPLTESHRFITQIEFGILIAVPLALILSIIGGLFLTKKAMLPIASITHITKRINASDLGKRIDMDLPDDEIGHLGTTINGMLDRLEAAFQRERQFTADVSHELRTPLSLLKTQLSLARSRPRDISTLYKMMHEMEHDVDRMTSLVNEMLTLSSVEQSKGLQFETINIDLILSSVISNFQESAHKKSVSIIKENSNVKNLEVKGNPEQLYRVFSNLVENALKYTPAGGIIKILIKNSYDGIKVIIADSGVGIEKSHLAFLFDRFYRVDSSRTRQSGGFGLGLAIVKAIVESHGGSISVESTPGKGTNFTVSFRE